MLTPAEIGRIDDFRFKQRMPSGRRQCANCCAAAWTPKATTVASFGAKSSDYGVTGGVPAGDGGKR